MNQRKRATLFVSTSTSLVALGAVAALATVACKPRSFNETPKGELKGTEVGVGKVNTSLDILTGITPQTPPEEIFLVVGANTTIRSLPLFTRATPINARTPNVDDSMHSIYRLSDLKSMVQNASQVQEVLRSIKGTIVFRSEFKVKSENGEPWQQIEPGTVWTTSTEFMRKQRIAPEQLQSNLVKMLDTVTWANKEMGKSRKCVGKEIASQIGGNSEIKFVRGFHPPSGLLNAHAGASSLAKQACGLFQMGNPGQMNKNAEINCNQFSTKNLDVNVAFDCLPISEVEYTFDNTDGFGGRVNGFQTRHAWRVHDALADERAKTSRTKGDPWIPVNRLDEDHAVWDRMISYMTGAR